MKREREVLFREAAEITALLGRLDELIKEYIAAPSEREAAVKAEIKEVKERIQRSALHYEN